MMSGQALRKALPSSSLGNIPAMTLSVGTAFHIGTKQPPNSPTPKKNIVVYLNGLGFLGSACRAKYHASHGTTVDTQGMPFDSQISATGFVVSGVEVVTMRSAWLCRTSSRATCDARFGSDWLSLTTMSTENDLLPT